MPVTIDLFYSDYTRQLAAGCLSLAQTRCPHYPAECKYQGPLVLLNTRLARWLVVLGVDDHGVECLTQHHAEIAQARCRGCGHRPRVLPADVLPRKRYGLPVIERLSSTYHEGTKSLRNVAWEELLGDRTPAHTTLHGWTEGLGAYALGRARGEVGDALPASSVLETIATRQPAPRVGEVDIPPARYRSLARRDRLAAGAAFIATLRSVAGAPWSLATASRLVVRYGARNGIGFRTGLSCTSIEQVPPHPPADSPHTANEGGTNRCRTRGRSPPGDSSRSHP